MSQNLKALLKNEATKESSLYQVIDLIPKKEIDKRNKKKEWEYGYNQEFDVIVISKDGTIGEVYNIQGLKVALPSVTNVVKIRDKKPEEQYWEAVRAGKIVSCTSDEEE